MMSQCITTAWMQKSVVYKSYHHISGKICSCAILLGNFDICGLKIKHICIHIYMAVCKHSMIKNEFIGFSY